MDNARCITTVGGQVSFPRPSQPIFPFHLQHLQQVRGFVTLQVFAATGLYGLCLSSAFPNVINQ